MRGRTAWIILLHYIDESWSCNHRKCCATEFRESCRLYWEISVQRHNKAFNADLLRRLNIGVGKQKKVYNTNMTHSLTFYMPNLPIRVGWRIKVLQSGRDGKIMLTPVRAPIIPGAQDSYRVSKILDGHLLVIKVKTVKYKDWKKQGIRIVAWWCNSTGDCKYEPHTCEGIGYRD